MAQLRISVCLLVFTTSQLLDGLVAEEGVTCGPDEYFDGVVDTCEQCRNVCSCDKPEYADFCTRNCESYYERLQCTTITPDGPSIDRTLPSKSSNEAKVENHVTRPEWHDKPIPTSVLTNPLVWLSVVCIVVALIAILIVMVVLIRFARRTIYRPDGLLIEASQPGYSRSTSQVSSNSCSNCQEKNCSMAFVSEEKKRMLSDLQQSHQEAVNASS